MTTRPGIFLICLLMSSLGSFAQDSPRKVTEDGYIENMSEWVSVDLSVNNAYEKFAVHLPDQDIMLSPNTSLITRLNLNYEWLSAGFEFAPKFIPGNDDNDLKGSTNAFSFGTALIFKHWWFEGSFSRVRGYFLENTNDFNPNWRVGDAYTQFPDLQFTGFEVLSGYSANSRFSFRSLTSQTERQLKSTGSFIPALLLRYYIIDDKTPQANSSQRTDSFESSMGPGYAYTFVIRESFYVSTGLIGSVGYLNTKLTTRTQGQEFTDYQDNFILRWQLRSGIGYNGTRTYGGIYGSFQGAQYKQENTTAMNTEDRLFFHIFIGYRFKAPKPLKEKFDWLNDQIPE